MHHNTGLILEISWVAALAGLETLYQDWPRSVPGPRRKLVNLSFTVFNHVLVPPMVVLALATFSHYGLFAHVRLPFLVQLAVAALVYDVIGYAFHRASHEVEFLWRFHQVHHLDRDMDFSLGTRVHTVEIALHYALICLAGIALGDNGNVMTVFATLWFATSIFHHTNIRLPQRIEPALRTVLNTPRLHVVHHHADIKDNTTNYGFVFSIWDRLFGTYNGKPHTPADRIGVSYSEDLPYARLWTEPFRRTALWAEDYQPEPYNQPEPQELVASAKKG